MGSFSFIYADRPSAKYPNRKCANITYGVPARVLIPQEFGGGHIDGRYQDYGLFTTENGETFDVYELIAVWNKEAKYKGLPIGPFLLGLDNVSKINGQKLRDKDTDNNHYYGIEVGCYDEQLDALKYPLRIVHQDNPHSYEECKQISYGDPEQGFYPYSWTTYYRKRKSA